MYEERWYQSEAKEECYAQWGNAFGKNVLLVLPTGAGKTFIFTLMLKTHSGYGIAIAHRKELVSQMSCALAQLGVSHKVLAPSPVVNMIRHKHMKKFGRVFVNPQSSRSVASVDYLLSKRETLKTFLEKQTMWVTDEAHHISEGNKWYNVIKLMPHARGLGVTATPLRADGKGLGAHASGVFHSMVVGPSMRTIIEDGYLTDFEVASLPSDMRMEEVKASSGGDWSRPVLRQQAKKSHIVGDVVEHYMTWARGKMGVTFVTDIETGIEVAAAYNKAGIRAECISSRTDGKVRDALLEEFERRNILQLVNVDLFGEGFDLPAIQCASFARPTQSYALFVQQFGRALRLLLNGDNMFDLESREGRLQAIANSEKPVATILDHVGNVFRHNGPPDLPKHWTLDGRSKTKRRDPDEIPCRQCVKCSMIYRRILDACPYCGKVHVPAQHNAPEFVDGNLVKLDAETIRKMRGDIAQVDRSTEQYLKERRMRGGPEVGIRRDLKLHTVRKEAQSALREIMSWWATAQQNKGRGQEEIYKRFYWQFDVDMMSAQALNTGDTRELAERMILEGIC